ncbi:unnamed protein product [Meloidogyne enterolobii]|uniref:Uncharacterized protein n=1 Tax=Meloidogyne enterolobii TaxID=390850 RepID=A0ACB0YDB3_MELEN
MKWSFVTVPDEFLILARKHLCRFVVRFVAVVSILFLLFHPNITDIFPGLAK